MEFNLEYLTTGQLIVMAVAVILTIGVIVRVAKMMMKLIFLVLILGVSYLMFDHFAPTEMEKVKMKIESTLGDKGENLKEDLKEKLRDRLK
ncbi:hypothetical protein [Algivirga pacifica]|uniref:Uncharacterized protein n=1 Tax=Algivirga pacifica TaxID=1162670 RepID=A0ABP9DJR9_9BACT